MITEKAFSVEQVVLDFFSLSEFEIKRSALQKKVLHKIYKVF